MKSELRELGGGGSGRKIRQYRNTSSAWPTRRESTGEATASSTEGREKKDRQRK